MAHDDKRPPAGAAPKGGDGKSARAAKSSAERPFDMWLQKQLHAMYDEIASEPLPNDLINLIDHDAAKADSDKAGSGGKTPGGKKA
jgi:hypothetical protein